MFVVILAFLAGCAAMYYAFKNGLIPENKSDSTDGSSGNVAAAASRDLGLSAQVLQSKTNSDEHVNLLTDIINRLWPYINQATAVIVRETVEPRFAETLPGPLKSLHFTKMDLGNVPIRLDNVVVHQVNKKSNDSDDDSVQLDMDILWKSDSDIRLKADFTGSFGVKTIQFEGRISVLMKPLFNAVPIVGAVQVAFINPPKLSLDFTGLASIGDFSVVERTIQKVTNQVLSGILVLPHRITVKLEPTMDLREVYQAPIGVARITCLKGRGLKVERKRIGRGDVPDTYCKIKVGCEPEQQTSVQKDSLTPVWKEESFDFLLCDNDQILRLEAWDKDDGTLDSDDLLGTATVTVGDLLLAGKTMEVELQQEGNRGTGAFIMLHCDVRKFTNSSVTSMESIEPNHLGGLKTVIVTQVTDLPIPKEEASSFVRVVHGEQEFKTGTVAYAEGIDALNPTFDTPMLIQLRTTEQAKEPVKFYLMNDTDKVLAEAEVTYDDLMAAANYTVLEKRQLSNGAFMSFSVSIKGIQDSSTSAPVVAAGADGEVPAELQDETTAGAAESTSGPQKVRVAIKEGSGFKVHKHRFKRNDVPDVYVQVKFGSSPQIWRTRTIKNSVAPKWEDEDTDYTLLNLNQIISLDVFDENRRGKDDYLGAARTTVGKVLLNGGSAEVELQMDGAPTGAYITLTCERL